MIGKCTDGVLLYTLPCIIEEERASRILLVLVSSVAIDGRLVNEMGGVAFVSSLMLFRGGAGLVSDLIFWQ